MPRLDDNEAIAIGLVSSEEVEADRDNPGLFGPFDLCNSCYATFSCESEVAHPSYDGWLFKPYRCNRDGCNQKLTDHDD